MRYALLAALCWTRQAELAVHACEDIRRVRGELLLHLPARREA